MIKICVRYAKDMDEAGALYNEAMLKVFNHLKQYNNQGEFPAWVQRIVRNTCIDFCRRETRFAHQEVNDTTEQQIIVDPDVYARLSGNEIVLLLQQLPRNTALVFNLYVLEGYKHHEIAKTLNIATGTSKWHLNEARRLLKIKLDTLLQKEIYAP